MVMPIAGPILIVVAVEAEASAIGAAATTCGVRVVVGGIGRTNAACATTEAILKRGPFAAVISAGVAGRLPSVEGCLPLNIGEAIVGSECVYAEEGLITPDGFRDMRQMGFPLGDFAGNGVPVDPGLLARLGPCFRCGPIATVATCSGTDEAADEIARRTGALAEAMEGAAVVHAARRLGVPAIELRAISNTTGDRHRQRWDLTAALAALGPALALTVDRLRSVPTTAVT